MGSSSIETTEFDVVQFVINAMNKLDLQYCVTLILGAVIVYSFASSRYNVPTFARTSIGNLAQLSPKSLAPDSRYRKGFHIYLFWLMSFYLALCVIGPKILDIPGLAIPQNWKDTTLWPIGAASTLMTLGIARDSEFPGNIENYFRRKAHEAAYIPTAVSTLSHQLASFDLGGWLEIWKDDKKVLDAVQTLSGSENIMSVFDAAKLGEGKLVSWIRGNVLLHCLGHLSGSRYDAIKAQDENKDAVKFVTVLQGSIRSRLTPSLNLSNLPDDAALSKDLESFIEGSSALLASTLLQAMPEARDLSETITTLGFKEIDSAGSQTWTEFATLGTALLLGAAIIVWVLAYFSYDIIFNVLSRVADKGDKPPFSAFTKAITIMAASTAIVYIVAFVVLMYLREKRLNGKKWEEKLGSQIYIIKWGGVSAGLISTLGALLLPGTLQGALGALIFNLVVCLMASAFFVLHMRSAATAGNRSASVARHVLGAGTWLHAIVAVTVTFGLSVATQRMYVENGPDWSMAAATASLRAIANDPRMKAETSVMLPNGDSVRGAFHNIERNFNATSESVHKFVDTLPDAPSFNDLTKSIGEICTSLDKPELLNGNFFKSSSNCQPIEGLDLSRDDFRRSFVVFSRSMGKLWDSVTELNAYRTWTSFKSSLSQYFLAALFSLFASLGFSLAARFGRIEQLRNEIDRFDESTIERLKSRAKCHFRQTGMVDDLESWLARPNPVIGLLTPLEGVRYRLYRPSLFDSLPIRAPQIASPCTRAAHQHEHTDVGSRVNDVGSWPKNGYLHPIPASSRRDRAQPIREGHSQDC
jgi:hypothetical protein